MVDNECQMNGKDAPHQGRLPHLWRAGLRCLALVSFAFLAAACDGSSASPGVASIGSTTSTTVSYTHLVPTAFAHHEVTALGGTEQVCLLVGTEVVATHQRCWSREQISFDPRHWRADLA